MSPRARRSESITMPPGNHPGLIRYKDEKIGDEKHNTLAFDDGEYNTEEHDESDLDAASDDSYDPIYSNDSSTQNSMLIERENTGR